MSVRYASNDECSENVGLLDEEPRRYSPERLSKDSIAKYGKHLGCWASGDNEEEITECDRTEFNRAAQEYDALSDKVMQHVHARRSSSHESLPDRSPGFDKRSRMLGLVPGELAQFEGQPKAYKVLGMFDETQVADLNAGDVQMLRKQEKGNLRENLASGRMASKPSGPYNVHYRRTRGTDFLGEDNEVRKMHRQLGVTTDELSAFITSPKAYKVLGLFDERASQLSATDRKMLKQQRQFQSLPATPWPPSQFVPPSSHSPGLTGETRKKTGRVLGVKDEHLAMFKDKPKAYKVLGVFDDHTLRPLSTKDLAQQEKYRYDAARPYPDQSSHPHVPNEERDTWEARDKRTSLLGMTRTDIEAFKAQPKPYKHLGMWNRSSGLGKEGPARSRAEEDILLLQERLQYRSERNLGVMCVKTKYDFKQELLHVVVVEAKNLPVINRLDSWVELRLVNLSPRAPDSLALRTSIQKNTANPIFDEAFLFPLSTEALSHHHLLLTTKDHFNGNEWIGSVLLPLAHFLLSPGPYCNWHHIRESIVLEEPPVNRHAFATRDSLSG